MWKIKDQAHGLEKKEVIIRMKSMLESLNGKIPGLIKIELGVDYSMDATSSDVVLYSEFESKAALDAYQVNPLHEDVKNFIGEARSEKRLVDYEI